MATPYQHLTLSNRILIAHERYKGSTCQDLAQMLKVHRTTIARELRRPVCRLNQLFHKHFLRLYTFPFVIIGENRPEQIANQETLNTLMQHQLKESIRIPNETEAPNTANGAFNEDNRLWLHRLLKRFGGKTIYVYDKKYLTRYYLWGNGSGDSFELYVHHMRATDSFRWLHNHPWKWFISFVFSGSYVQDTYNRDTKKSGKQHIRWFNIFRGINRYHSIRELPRGTAWTLVLAPPKLKDYNWGYWNDETNEHIEDNLIGHESARIEIFGNKLLKD